ncbi:ATP-grasp fold amidoligase family protein [Paracoccus lichenicola]|nr:ATP-grasp fold amidoligase family protein [Paracoccus lichenicola]
MSVFTPRKAWSKVRRHAGRFFWKKAREVRSDYVAAVLFHIIHHKRFSLLVGQNTFSERIMLRNAKPDPRFSILSDKYEVREFVQGMIGPDHLIPVYKVVDDLKDLDFTSLPDAFVMKATHGSRWVKLVEDKHKENPEDLKALAASWLSQSYYPAFRESHYKSIKPRIIFERLLLQDGLPANDYKIHCFRKNGKLTQIVQVHSDRFGHHKLNLFTSDWMPLDIRLVHERAPAETVKKPAQLDEMLDIADRLSTGINYVRVDLYESSGQVFFGELTFTPGAGLMRLQPPDADRQWAALFDKDNHSGSALVM